MYSSLLLNRTWITLSDKDTTVLAPSVALRDPALARVSGWRKVVLIGTGSLKRALALPSKVILSTPPLRKSEAAGAAAKCYGRAGEKLGKLLSTKIVRKRKGEQVAC